MKKKFLLMMMLSLLFTAMGTNLLRAEESNGVAKVGNTEYATIDEAIANWTNNTTLTLLADVTLSDVVTLKSTEHHTLDLGTHTMTAASGKHAIEITCEGRTSASYAITVNADKTNPGGITATGKSCIYYYKSDSTKDRPIIRIYNGVFNGSYSINSRSNGNTNCPQIWIYGGTFNGNVNLTKNMLRVFGGVFNGWINCSGDSSAYREISGGTFKSWQFMTADADNKFWVGTSKANYDVGMYVNDEGYLVVGGGVVTEPNTDSDLGVVHKASTTNYGGWSSYLNYSSAKDNGLYYTSVEEALADNNTSTGSVTVYVDELDMTGISYKGTIVVPVGNDITITNVPENCTVKFSDDTVLTPDESGNVYTKIEVATLEELKNALVAENELPIIITETIVIPADKTVTIDLNGKTVTRQDEATNYAINNLGTLTIQDTKGNGSINARGIYNGYGDGAANVATAKITVESGTINAKGTNGGAAIFNYGVADIQGGNFTSIGGYSLNNQDGSTMTIAAGVSANNGVYNSNATLTIDGGEIYGNRSGCHVIYAWNSTLTINGGEFYNNNSGNATIMSAGTSVVTINDGTFGIKDGRVPGDGNTWTSCLTDTQNSAEMTVNGGTFNGGFRVQAGTSMTINGGSFNDVYGSNYNIYGTVTVTGGTFTDDTAKDFATTYVAEGYEVAEDGTVGKASVAEVNGVKYTSLADAIAAAQAGSEIKLLADATVEGTLALPAGIKLTSNGHTITGSIRMLGDLELNGPLTITGGLWVGKSGETLTATLFGDKLTASYFMFQRGTYTINAYIDAVYGYLSYEGTFEVNSTIHTTGANGEVLYINGNVTLNDGAVLDSDNSVFVCNDNAVLTLKSGSKVDSNVSITTSGAKLIIDATGMTAGESANITGTVTNSGNGTIAVVGNDNLEASIVDGKVVLAAKPAAKIGEQGYATLADAYEAAVDGDVIVLNESVTTFPVIKKAVTFKGGKENAAVEINVFLAQNFTAINGTVKFENLTFNKPLFTEQGGTKPGLTIEFEGCNFNVPSDEGYAILIGTSWSNSVVKGLKVNECNFKYVGDVFKGGYMLYVQCVNEVSITNNTIDGNNLYRGAIHLGDATEHATVATVSNNTIKNFCRGVMMGNRKAPSSATISGNTFDNINYSDKDSKPAQECAPIFIHSNATAEALQIALTNNKVENCTNPMIYSEDTDLIKYYVTEFTGNTVAGAAVELANSYYAPNQIFPVATINDAEYFTLQAAFDAVKDGETITLIDNVTVSVATAAYNDGTYIDGVRYTGDKSFTVDFNGKTVTDDGCVNDYLIYINNKGEKASEITFTNGTIVSANGCWSAVCVNSSAATQNVVLNLNGMNITNSNDAVYSGNPVVRARELATVNVNNGTTITSNGASYGVAANTDNSTININEGATIVQQNSGETGGNSVFAAVGGKGVINIKGGTITSDKFGVHTMTTGTPVINISGGTITAPVALKSSTNGGNGELATINVTGGTINGTLETNTENGKIVVSGGTFSEAVAQEYCADGFVPKDNGDGTYGVELAPVAKVGENTYRTFAEAADAAQAGDEIKLLANIEGDITVPANVTLNGNGFAISGGIFAEGDITFAGVTTAADFDANVANTAVNIPAGASLQLTGSARLVIGHGATFNITGTIEDAKTADKATLVPSLKIAAGASITGNGVTFNVNNAYIVANANTTSKNNNADGTLDFNINNSIWEQTGVLAFYVPTSGKDPVVNFELKNSVLTTTSHLVFSVTKGEIVIDNSLVNEGTSRQIENRSTMTIKNGSVVNGAVATSSNAINPGTIIVENATYAVAGEFSGAAEGTGTLIIKKGANVSVGSIKAGANVVVDAEGMAAGDKINFTANLSQFTGTLSVINNDNLEAKIVDGKIVLVVKPVAKIGNVEYTSLEAAVNAAKDGEEIDLLKDVELTSPLLLTKNNILDGNGFKLTPAEGGFTHDGNNAVIVLAANMSGYEANRTYTVKNLTIEGFNTPSRIVRANFCDATIQDCSFVDNTSESIITSAYAVLNVEDNTFTNNTTSFAVINVGSDVSDGTNLKAEITRNKFYNNKAATAGIFLASSADVTDNHFKGNTHTGDNANAAAILAGPYTGNMAYTVNIKSNAFENAMSKDGTALPSVFAEDWSSNYDSTTSFDLSLNYWDGNEPVAGTAYKTSGDNPQVTVKSYYKTYTDGTLGGLVEYPQGNNFNGYTRTDAIWGEVWGNAKESFVVKVLDANDNVMGTTSLNNIGGIINGNVNVTWTLLLNAESNTDKYWTMEWTTAPTINNMPAKVELWVDGVKVSGGPVVLNGPDNINMIYAAVTDNTGKILAYHTNVQDAIKAAAAVTGGARTTTAGTVEFLSDVTVDKWIMFAENLTIDDGSLITLNINGVTIDGNGKALTVKSIESAGNGGYLFYDAQNLTVKDLTINIADGLVGGIGLQQGTISNVNFNGGNYGVFPGANGVTIENCTFNGTKSSAVYYEEGRQGIVVKNNSFNTADGAYAITMRSNEQFTGNTINKGRVNIANSSSATVTDNNFGQERFKVYNAATATISGNTINNLVFNETDVPTESTFTNNTLSPEAQAAIDALPIIAGEGTEANPYTISNLAQLKAFRDDVNAGNKYAGKYIKVTATEIDLNNEEWTPIAYMGKTFEGNFDGNNVTVKNLKITKALTNSAENNGIGFFGRTDSPATIENIIIENVDITGSLYVGAIVGFGYTGKHVKGCTVKGNIAIDAWWYAGVIGGNGYMNLIDNCHVIGNDGSYIKGNDGSYIGGIWGFRGEGNNKITNCIVTNLDIIGVDRVGGICGIGHYGNTISGCDAEDVTVTATDPEATTIGLLVGATQGNVDEPTIFENNDASDITAQIDNGDDTYTEVTNLYGTNIDGGVAVTNYVAQIVGGTQYATLAEAVAAAENNDVITLLPTNASIAMNASLYGKSVTITGTATVDWNKGFLFVGRGGEGNATLTFDNANLTSASNSGSYGIHVSGREKDTNNKYDGTLVINNSTIDLDYLINRGTIELDGGNLTVKNGFGIAGRPGTETESGDDATATITLNNNSKVVVKNHNGMGLGIAATKLEGFGIMNINSGSTFETTQSFTVTAKGTMNVNGGNVKVVGTLTNNGAVNVTGESILDIETLTGEEINFLDGAIIKNSTVGGGVFVKGKVTFRGDNTFAMLYDFGTLTGYYGTTANMEWIVEEGASLTLTDKARYGLGYGDNVTINGSITNALEARENLTEEDRSLFMHGLVAQESKGWNCNSKFTVEDAYVVIGSNNSFGNKPGEYGGNYTINFKNSVVDASRITFYEALSSTEFTFEDSDVKIGTFMTRDTDSKFTLKNSKVLSTAIYNGNDEGNYNAGELTLDKSSLTYSAEFANTGTLNIGESSTFTAPSVVNNGTINFTALSAKLDTDTEGLTIVDNVNNPDYAIAYLDGTYQYAKYVAQIGEAKYLTLQEAIDAVAEDETIVLLGDITFTTGANGSTNGISYTRGVNFTLDLSGKTITSDLGGNALRFKIGDGNDITNTEVTINVKNGKVVSGSNNWCAISAATADNSGNNLILNLTDLEVEANKAGDLAVKSWAGAIVNINNVDVTANYAGGFYACGGEITLDNCTVDQKGLHTSPYLSVAVAVSNGGKMTVNSGTYSAAPLAVTDGNNQGTSHGSACAQIMNSGGTLIINGGTFSNDNFGDNSLATAARYLIYADAKGDLQINGGTFNALNGIIDNTTNTGVDVATVTLKGGTYSANPKPRYNPDAAIPEGYIVVENDGTYSVVEDQVAKIGDVTYKLLQEAFDAAQYSDEIVVLKNIVLTEGITVAADKVVTLNLAGYTISQVKACTASYQMIENKGALTIKDSTEGANGKISFKDTGAGDPNFGWGSYTVRNAGTLVVENGTIEHLGAQSFATHCIMAIFQYSGSSTINGGTISTPNYRSARLWKGDMTINGGTFDGQLWVQSVDNTAKLTINGGNFSPNGNDASSVFVGNTNYDAAFTVTGGTFETKIGCNDADNLTGDRIIGGLFSQSAVENTNQALLGDGFEFVGTADANGYYSVIKTSGTFTRTLSSGWSWFSYYIDIEGSDGLDALKEDMGAACKQFKSQTAFTFYDNNWYTGPNALTGTNVEDMYMVEMRESKEISLSGKLAVPAEKQITLKANGWTWIGYPLENSINVSDALATFNSIEGDYIKSKTLYAEYVKLSDGTYAWKGSLNSMIPGEGYKYKSVSGDEKGVYYSSASNRTAVKANVTSENNYWVASNSKYSSNMTVVAMMSIDNEIVNDSYEIAAFANGECRGSARAIYDEDLNAYMLYLTIHGEDVENITFKYYDVNYGTEYELGNVVVYSSDAILGSINNPYMFNLDILNVDETSINEVNVYPNPTTTNAEIDLNATCDKVEVFNALGVKVAEYSNVDSIDALETAGVYVIRVTIDGNVRNCRLVVK